MKKILISSLILASFVFSLSVMPVLAGDADKDAKKETKIVNTVKKAAAKVKSKSSSETNAADLVCMQNAVAKRETAIINAASIQAPKIKALFLKRVDDLKKAWTIANNKDRRNAIKTAWKSYNAETSKTKKDFKKGIKKAWKDFNNDKKACKSSVKSDESGSEGGDISL